MKSERTGRRRHLRRSSFSRFRTDPSGVSRSAALGYWDREADGFSPETPAGATFVSASNQVTVTAHGFADGSAVRLLENGGALPAELSEGVTYYTNEVDVNNFTLHATADDGISGASIVAFTDDGSGSPQAGAAVASERVFDLNKIHRPETISSVAEIADLP